MEIMIETQNLRKFFPITGGVFKRKVGEVRAVDDVDISIRRGECFGLVGESGCGKTTLGKTMIRLYKPTAGSIYLNVPGDVMDKAKEVEDQTGQNTSKEVTLHKYDIASLKGRRLKPLRRKMQIVYQDPSTSLNPRMLVKDIVGEPLKVQGLASGGELRKRVVEILGKVGLTERHLYRYPHEFSGGQRQRIAVARALVIHPQFVVLDEPTSAVDVSVRAQLLRLFQELQKDLGLTYMFVSHDLSVVECISDRVGVMYLGKMVELSATKDLYDSPLHPYSQALFSAIPIPDPTRKKERITLTGEVPSPVNPPAGCRFHPRCSKVMDACRKVEPQLIDMGNEHCVACHLFKSEIPEMPKPS